MNIWMKWIVGLIIGVVVVWAALIIMFFAGFFITFFSVASVMLVGH